MTRRARQSRAHECGGALARLRSRLALALFAVAAVAISSRVLPAQDVECDPGDVEVRALEFRGNRAVGDDELATRVTTTPSSAIRRGLRLPLGAKRCLDREAFPQDLLALEAYYHKRGFYYARVDTIVQPLGGNAVKVTFTISEGAPTILQSYEVTGLEGIRDSAMVLNARRLRVGRPFDIDLFSADMDTIVHRLRNAGYYRAELLHEYNRDSLTATARITVLPHRRARFGDPVFQVTPLAGREQQLDTSVIRRVMGIVPGTWYSDRVVVDAQRSLFGLGIYRHIEVSPPDSLQPSDTLVVLLVQLTEDYMKQLDSEFGWATLDCGRVRMLYTDRNWLHSARRLEVTGQASKLGYARGVSTPFTDSLCTVWGRSPLKKDSAFSKHLHYYAGASVRQPRLLGFRWTPTLSVYSERRGEYTAYLRTTWAGADLSATRELAPRMPIRFGYTFEYGFTEAPDAAMCALFNRCDIASRAVLNDTTTLGIASAAFSRLRTDNPITPTRGYALRGEFRTSASSLLLTSRNLFFNKGTGDGIWYRPLGDAVVSLRLRGGAVVGRRLGPNDPGFVPPQERLYAGGATSVRGFQQNELGDVVYIAGRPNIDTTFVRMAGTDSIFHMVADTNPDGTWDVSRTVPLGGNSLTVLNLDLRFRDPFFFPNVLQYTLFLDGGEVWTRTKSSGLGIQPLRWTPGFGVRALTPVGPVQVNVGYNPYNYQPGPLYYNPNVSTLHCVSPDNAVDLVRDASGQLKPLDPAATCGPFRRGERKGLQKLTFTFSIGPDF